VTDMPAREVHAANRYEWEAIIRRVRFGGCVRGSGRRDTSGRQTRGGLAGSTVTAVALVMATYADPDGTRVYPGDAQVAVALESSLRTVEACRRLLVELGLLTQTDTGRTRTYRLTLPSDLLDRVEVLTPGQIDLAARRLRDTHRGRKSRPEDPPTDPDGASSGPPNETECASGGRTLGGPEDARTRPLTRPQVPPTHTPSESFVRPSPFRASTAVIENREFCPPPTPTATTRCVDHPALPGGQRPDGQPWCPACRATRRTTPVTGGLVGVSRSYGTQTGIE